MKNLIPLAVLLIFIGACTYNNKPAAKNIYLFPYGDSSFKWTTYEKQDSITKKQFFRSYPPEFKSVYDAYFNSYTNLVESFKNLKAALHVMDVNNDGLNDIIFEGYSGGEPIMTAIYLQNASGFKQVFTDLQTVSRLDIDGGKLKAIYITDPGCCAEYLTAGKIYQVNYRDTNLKFKPLHYTAYYQRSKLPKQYLDQPKAFVTLTDSAKLRDKPAVANRDTLFLGGDLHFGNDVGSIGKGSKGRAIAQSKDNAGNTWWFVELQPNAVVSGNVFYEKEDNRKAGKMGWINSRDLKITD